MEEFYSEEAERALLSTLVTHCDKSNINAYYSEFVLESVPLIFDKMFYIPQHKKICNAIKKLYPDRISLTNIQIELAEKISPSEIAHIIDVNLASVMSVRKYIFFLKELLFRRFAYARAKSIQEAAALSDITSILANAKAIERSYNTLTKSGKAEDFFTKAERQIRTGLKFIPSAFTNLNERIIGFSRKELSALGGKSGHLKTAFVIDNSLKILDAGLVEKIHYVSVEHPGEVIATRIVAREFGISYKDIILGKTVLSEEDCFRALHKRYGNKFYITDSATTQQQIVEAIRSVKADQHIIDHAQEISYTGGKMFEGISTILLELKTPAREQNANILFMSQVVDKEINERVDKIPKSADLYGSARIKQEARQLLMVYYRYQDAKEFHEDDPEQYVNDFQIHCYKSTFTDTGRVSLKAEPACGRFSE